MKQLLTTYLNRSPNPNSIYLEPTLCLTRQIDKLGYMLRRGVLKTWVPTERHGTSGLVFCSIIVLVIVFEWTSVLFHNTRGLGFYFTTQEH